MTYHPLLVRQMARATPKDGELDARRLLELVSSAYEEKDRDRRRIDRANRLMQDELDDTLLQLELQNLRFKAALDNMAHGLCLFDKGGRLAVLNRRFLEIYQLEEKACPPGTSLEAILGNSRALQCAHPMQQRLLRGEHIALDPTSGVALEQEWPDRRIISITRTRVGDGGYLDTIADVTEQRRAATRIAHMARHDALTDLPNRVLLRERLLEVVRNGSRNERCAIMCLDLDRFKQVNDTLGHPTGDALLVAVSQRLSRLIRDSDIVARLGGDEFAVLQRHIKSTRDPCRLARRIILELSRPYEVQGHHIQIGASIGLDIWDVCRLDPDEALRNADLALYQAKANGRGTFALFEPAMHKIAQQRQQLETDLRASLANREFEVHYQPQYDLKTGALDAFEALARWRHRTRGLVSPAEFISTCEEAGMIDELGIHILEIACRDACHWPPTVKVAVNLSPVQFRSRKLVGIVKDVLCRTGLAAERLELEITESLMLDNTSLVLEQLRAIKQMGCNISLDDFGTGYSSLSYIRQFPFDKVKIDQSFVRDISENMDNLAIIRAVAGMCGSLGIKSTAEGVETPEQLAVLRREHCDSVQGYLFSRPVELEKTFSLIHQSSPLNHSADPHAFRRAS